jgi:hypothetical protein
VFLNLSLLTDGTFRDHNFSDFWNDAGGGGDPVERVTGDRINWFIRTSYEPDSTRPGRLTGFSPEFDPIFPLTFSQACCDAFIRSTVLPITPRDYYLSKLFQFLRSALIARFEGHRLGLDFDLRLHEVLDLIPTELLPPDQRISWIGFWWDFYGDTLSHPLPDVIVGLEGRVVLILEKGRAKKRSPGPQPDEKHQIVAQIVRRPSSREWMEELPRICSALDKENVPCVLGRAKDTPTTWIAKLRMPGGKEKVVKDIQYRLKQAAKIASRSN